MVDNVPRRPGTVEQKLSNYFAGRTDIALVILYGSAAVDALRAGSDVDVAVAKETRVCVNERVELHLELSALLGAEADVVDLNSVHGLIVQEILTKGILIKNDKPLVLAKIMKDMWLFEADMMPNIRMIRDANNRRFAYGPKKA